MMHGVNRRNLDRIFDFILKDSLIGDMHACALDIVNGIF